MTEPLARSCGRSSGAITIRSRWSGLGKMVADTSRRSPLEGERLGTFKAASTFSRRAGVRRPCRGSRARHRRWSKGIGDAGDRGWDVVLDRSHACRRRRGDDAITRAGAAGPIARVVSRETRRLEYEAAVVDPYNEPATVGYTGSTLGRRSHITGVIEHTNLSRPRSTAGNGSSTYRNTWNRPSVLHDAG